VLVQALPPDLDRELRELIARYSLRDG